ncbi:MAG TPA: DNA polymerase ligase N-terminal domain-containing protein [Acidobacteriota bacterium]|nr:DNA polymerase ligase N-terminal domain-containing protein [Acidobacteriota bacterium]
MGDKLEEYKRKRNFGRTSEPRGDLERSRSGRLYVIQKHAARQLHYDLRLELDGVLLSWAIPKGPSLDPSEKRLAVQVEDHPLEYADFEGTIAEDDYGGGTVMIWDRGEWEPLENDPRKAYEKGKLKFRLQGERLKGRWDLVRFHSKDDDEGKNWLLIKEKDEEARSNEEVPVVEEFTSSVVTSRSMEEIAAGTGSGKKRQKKRKSD